VFVPCLRCTVAQKVLSYEEACVTDERWKNVEIRIVCPTPTDDCDPSNDLVFDGLEDKVVDLFQMLMDRVFDIHPRKHPPNVSYVSRHVFPMS
jgi:hypothetical protein